jgi:[ribosomal protein S5]-alanine N-acetyltransferase
MSKTNIRINGDRIYLRELELSDVNQTYVDWLNDPEVSQFLETRYEVQTLGSVHEYVEQMIVKKHELFFAICLKGNDKHIGNIKLGPINQIHKFAEVSLFIGDKNQWGKGFATTSINILSNYVFSELSLHKMMAGAYSNNIGSIRAFGKAGFIIEGTWKDQYLCDGEYVDRICFSLINNEV